MSDKEVMKRECLDMVNEAMVQYKLAQMVLNVAEPGMGDMLIDVLVEELSKLRPESSDALQSGEQSDGISE